MEQRLTSLTQWTIRMFRRWTTVMVIGHVFSIFGVLKFWKRGIIPEISFGRFCTKMTYFLIKAGRTTRLLPSQSATSAHVRWRIPHISCIHMHNSVFLSFMSLGCYLIIDVYPIRLHIYSMIARRFVIWSVIYYTKDSYTHTLTIVIKYKS